VKIRLKAIKFGADFRCSELTNYDKFRKSSRYPGDLVSGEAFLFISKSGNQMIWVLHVGNMKFLKHNGAVIKRIIDSRKWRIQGGSAWNPMMLADYAEEVGLELVGIKKFAQLYEERRAK